MKTVNETAVPLRLPLFRGKKRLRIALVGMPLSGKRTIFNAVSSASVHTGELAGTHKAYADSLVQIGLDEAQLVCLPSIGSLLNLEHDDLAALKYLLWGNDLPPITQHEPDGPPTPFSPPDVIIHVMDATALERHLELFLALAHLGRPMVIALNRMDEAGKKGLHINSKALSKQLGVPVVPTVALMGHGISELFATAVDAVRQRACPLPQEQSPHIMESLQPLGRVLNMPDVSQSFRVPHAFLLRQLAAKDGYFIREIAQHFPDLLPQILDLRHKAEKSLPRALEDELHADNHHRAALIFESVTRLGAAYEGKGWRYFLDELFLHPQWGLLGSLAVFAAVLFVVFEISAWLDSETSAKLVTWVSGWRPQSTVGVIGRAVADGLAGLVGIVVPYMIPLVILLVALEESGIMHRIAFVVDRGFHHIGLHGGVAVPFLLGLGCNVPALSAAAASTKGKERVIASVLITFVPCSARSAIILALAGKYLGGLGVFAIFFLTMLVIALGGFFFSRHYPESGPGQVQEIPPYALPTLKFLLSNTWERTSDILTIVTPLLVGGSVLLALLSHFGADHVINTLFTPISRWWLGLPVVLGVPILFGILRKELSLLMIYQALGTFDISARLDKIQIMTFLVFLTFYIPCISTFAVMLKTIGKRDAFFSVAISVSVALLISAAVRMILLTAQFLAS